MLRNPILLLLGLLAAPHALADCHCLCESQAGKTIALGTRQTSSDCRRSCSEQGHELLVCSSTRSGQATPISNLLFAASSNSCQACVTACIRDGAECGQQEGRNKARKQRKCCEYTCKNFNRCAQPRPDATRTAQWDDPAESCRRQCNSKETEKEFQACIRKCNR